MSARGTVKLVSILFSIIGFGMLAAGIAVGWNTRSFLARAESVQGRVVELTSDGEVFRPVVEYTGPGGQTARLRGSVGSNPPSHQVGELVNVRYDPATPSEARLDSFLQNWFFSVLLGGMGLVFAGIGQGIIWFGILRGRRNEWLRQHGRRTQAKLQQVRRDTSLEVNGRHPFRIVAQRLDPRSNSLQVFESEAIWFDPTQFVKPDAALTVMVDPENPKRYWMDTGFLPKVK